MMPGTTNRIVHQQTVGQGRTVVSTGRIEREHLVPATREDDSLSIRVTEQHRTVGYLRDGDADCEVRSSECRCGVAHLILTEARPRSSRTSRRASSRW